jgi:hypothetical protein
MKKLWFLMGAAIALFAIALTAQGCAKPCNDLASQCGLCGDADYAAACREVVDEANDDVCQAQLGTFQSFCTDTGAGGGTGGGGTSGCNGTVCGGACVDTASDPSFCGGCVSSCSDPTPLCAGGVCTDSCPASMTLCGTGSCVVLSTDPNNCGGCDTVCATGQLCSQGACVDSCDPDSQAPTECSGSCVSLSNDPLSCGACDNACDPSEVCSSGDCSANCGNGETACCGKCVSTVSDPTHCGACSADCSTPVCQAGEVCNQGICANTCGSLTDCGGACVDTNGDASHCGGCNTLCPAGTSCTNGGCSNSGCPAGETDCFGTCVNLQNSPASCGACGTFCDATAPLCAAGVCAAGCGPAQPTDCSGVCVDTTSDPDNCLTCGTACAVGEVCDQGSCEANCSPGLTSCNGGCVDLDGDLNNCGVCGSTCNDASVCTADACLSGTCDNQSGALICNDGNQCTVDLCDPVGGCCGAATPCEEITYAQVEALCVPLLGLDPTTNCIFCNPIGAACDFLSIDDGINCTDDLCPTTVDPTTMMTVQDGSYLPAGVSVNNNANCPTNCASTCDKDAHVDPLTPGSTDSNGCLLNAAFCAGAESCYDACNPDSAASNPTSGCIENDNNCVALEICEPDDAQADVNSGCCGTTSFPCTVATEATDCCSTETCIAGVCQ